MLILNITITTFIFAIFNFEKGYDKGHSQEIPKPRVLKPLTLFAILHILPYRRQRWLRHFH